MEHRNNSTWFTLITGLFVGTLIVSNIIAVKLVNIFGLILPAAVVLFPLAYIIGDVMTEVYGYARARRVIWIGFFANLVAVGAILLAGAIPAVPFWTLGYSDAGQAQTAYQRILGFAPRLLAASFVAYLAGEFLNSFVLAKMKIATKGRFLWMRTIGSTLIGQAADTVIFITAAFAFTEGMSFGMIAVTIVSQWGFKVAYEILATPLTYQAVRFLKKKEGMDVYDRKTNFNPLAFFKRGSASEEKNHGVRG
ncbi:MAG: queuosine precursor transporter [Spirochaetales bacterium]|nr:queuosine precursor transporter [Spirochaetales bacterium]